jgi:hypothetical protein
MIKAIDAAAKADGVTRSEKIRQFVIAGLGFKIIR